jgi:hypothetical protein
MLRPNSRSCRTASIRSGIAGGLAGELAHCRRWGYLLPLVLAANAVVAISAWMVVDLLMK